MSIVDGFGAELGLAASADQEYVISRDGRLELYGRDMDGLLAIIAAPPPPNDGMLHSAQRRRELDVPR